jgi:hypothetical protein
MTKAPKQQPHDNSDGRNGGNRVIDNSRRVAGNIQISGEVKASLPSNLIDVRILQPER